MAEKNLYWTESAIDCYRIKGRCSKCNLARLLESKCAMKKTVKMLIDLIGKPTVPKLQVYRFSDLTKTQQKIILAILHGAASIQDIATKLDIDTANVQVQLNLIYKKTAQQGVIYPHRRKLQTLIDYLFSKKKEKKQ